MRADLAELIDDRLEIECGLRLILIYALAQGEPPGHLGLGRNVAIPGRRREILELDAGEPAGRIGILRLACMGGVHFGARSLALKRNVDRGKPQRRCREEQGNRRYF